MNIAQGDDEVETETNAFSVWLEKFYQASVTHHLPRFHDTWVSEECASSQGFHRYEVDIDIPPRFNVWVQDKTRGFYLFLAVYLITIRRWSNDDEILMILAAECLNSHISDHLTPVRWQLGNQTTLNELLSYIKRELQPVIENELSMSWECFVDLIKQETQDSVELDISLGYSFDCTLPVDRKKSYDLTLEVNPIGKTKQAGNRYTLVWRYSSTLFLPEKMEEFSECYVRIFKRLLSQPNHPYLKMQLVSDTCYQLQTQEFNQSKCLFDGAELCIHQLFEKQVLSSPDKEAVLYDGKSLTYKELNDAANEVALYLIHQGVEAEQSIGLLIEDGLTWVIGIIGILKSCGVCVPLETSLSQDQWQEQCEAADITLLLTDDSLKQHLLLKDLPSNVTMHDIDLILSPKNDNRRYSANPTELMNRLNSQMYHPHHLAYLLFTKGYDGKNRTVALEHHSLVNTLLDISHRCHLDEDDSAIILSSFSSDLSIFDIFGVLMAGGRIIVPIPFRKHDPSYWLYLVKTYKVTLWNGLPQYFEQLLHEIKDPIEDKGALSSLRVCLLSGDWLPPSLPQRAWTIIPSIRILRLAGAIEASIWSIMYVIDQDTSLWESVPFGKPLSNQKAFILNDELQLCPVGVAGQICLAGAGVARDYFRDEQSTQAFFVWSDVLRERVYLTGGWGCYLSNGDIKTLGRRDRLFTINDQSIDLDNIEWHLRRHPNIINAHAIVIDHAKQSQIVVFVIPDETAKRTLTQQCVFRGIYRILESIATDH